MLNKIIIVILNVSLIIFGLTLLYHCIGLQLQKKHLNNEIEDNIKFILKPSKIWLSNEIKLSIIELTNKKQSSTDVYKLDESNKIVTERMYSIYIICETLILLSIICLFIVKKYDAFLIITESLILSSVVILTEFWFYRYIIYNTPILDINLIYSNLINKL